ncbi:ATP-binding protein [Conexibacter sp. JD483]|uniref:sensor histidine kinase n=1 Tax=unclassified Conexibacter TaxID=2627773 RepID=UPI00271DDA99|nr:MULTISPECIES: ATP-binding protein [unclassified Conexibacter]MDO8186101.1 ATP-binding protein [Conexibacter sp. CPCC 205706]MDO8199591.1 ATP-binding protein [Conexibacter sp. CPCC 205762]MDR9371866.1 ATP-binding protein [Conexibacter sp. JD483]
MTLRRRLALVAAAAVAVSIALASGIVYVVVRGELRGQLDSELRQVAERRNLDFVLRPPPGLPGAGQMAPLRAPGAPRDALGLQTTYVGAVLEDGTRLRPPGAAGQPRLPVDADTKAVAAGTHGAFLSDADVDGTAVRILTVPARTGIAIQIARPLTDVNRTLDRLALVLLLVSAGGIALAAGLGRLVARTALRPVGQLTAAVEHVGETGDLTRRIDVPEPASGAVSGGVRRLLDADASPDGDEIARLARSFNAMLGALEASVGRQRQLVADASHELRTPLTSLRTNIEVLALPAGLPEDERRRLLGDVVEQLEELSGLVGDLVELAREQEPSDAVEDVRLDLLVEEAVTRARRRPGAPVFAVRLAPTLVRGVPARLERAVTNLLDNAAKWSPLDAEVTVALSDAGELTVRDRGPGIAPSDLPHVFERFYRAPSARGMPGSGLGLAIVRQVAELHGGRASAEAAAGGGALMRLTLPGEPLEPGELATPRPTAAPAASPPRPPAPAASGGRDGDGGTSTRAG